MEYRFVFAPADCYTVKAVAEAEADREGGQSAGKKGRKGHGTLKTI